MKCQQLLGSNLPLNNLLTSSFVYQSYKWKSLVAITGHPLCSWFHNQLFLVHHILHFLTTNTKYSCQHIYYHKQPTFQLEWIEWWRNSSAVNNSIMVCCLKCTDPYSLKTSISQTLAIQLFVIVISWQLKLKNRKNVRISKSSVLPSVRNVEVLLFVQPLHFLSVAIETNVLMVPFHC